MKRAGVCAGSQNTSHIHKQHRGIFHGRHCNQHRLSRNTGIYLSKYRTRRNIFLKCWYSPKYCYKISLPCLTVQCRYSLGYSLLKELLLLFYNCVLHYSNSLKARRCHLLLTHGIAAYRIISYFLPFRCYNNRFLFLIIIYYAQKDKRKDGIK